MKKYNKYSNKTKGFDTYDRKNNVAASMFNTSADSAFFHAPFLAVPCFLIDRRSSLLRLSFWFR